MKSKAELGKVVKTADGSLTIRNPDIDEEYHSTAGAAFESEELYLARSGIADFWKIAKDCRVLDVGLGLSYNALTTVTKWLETDTSCDLKLYSLEINEALVEHLASGDGPWMEGWSKRWLEIAKTLEKQENGTWCTTLSHSSGAELQWTVYVGDSSQMELEFKDLNFIWQDAFSPTKNPELWSPQWFRSLGDRSKKECVLMTYSVARVVKDGLNDGGWDFERIPAPGKKRHWLRASKSQG